MTDIAKSILAINPNAIVSIENEDINQITWLHGTQPIAKQTILNKQKELQEIEKNRIATEQANKQSALTKLSALGLTEAEIKSIIG
jgi:hypothetical protein